jgi:programmed cell death protein 4
MDTDNLVFHKDETFDSESDEKRERKHSRQGNYSAKDIEKKMVVLKKRMAHHKPRQHTKSLSGSGQLDLQVSPLTSNDKKAAEIDRIVQRLQKSRIISDTRLPYGKNSRKSRTGRRGDVKKGGAGGHLVWGKPGDEATVEAIDDKKDPNYDSELEDSIRLQMLVMPVSQLDFECLVSAWVDEFYDHGDAQEVCELLRELAPTRAQIIRLPHIAISMALERKALQRELTSQLLSAVCDSHGLLNHALMEKAFDQILTKELEDLEVDVPDAPELVGCFIARAVADDLIPPKFVELRKAQPSSDVAAKALRKAATLLHIPHAYAHLDTLWLGSAGLRTTSHGGPTKQLSRAIQLMLKEYMDAEDKREVDRTIRELSVPHFLHELVFQSIMLVIERSTEEACRAVVELLEYLYKTGECSGEMIASGIRRIYKQMSDISLDVPSAYLIMDRFLKQALASGFIANSLIKEMPSKKRPRFISESVNRITGKDQVKETISPQVDPL